MSKFKYDKIRYKEISGGNFWKEPSAIVIYLYRILEEVSKIKLWFLRKFLNIIFVPIYKFFSVFVGISLPRGCKIGNGFVIFHFGAIALNENVIIGKNCTLRQGVTIGNRKYLTDVPIIGDNVNIGAGAVIIGDIKIGNNVDIGANSVVLIDVPDNHIAVGNPARIISKK